MQTHSIMVCRGQNLVTTNHNFLNTQHKHFNPEIATKYYVYIRKRQKSEVYTQNVYFETSTYKIYAKNCLSY